MGHDHALVGKRAPVCDVEFAGLRIIETLDLFRKHVHHEGIEVESLGKESKGLGAALVGVAFLGIFLFIHLLDDVSANFLARTQGFFERCNQFQASDLAHLAEDFVGGSKEIGIRARLGIHGRRSDSRFLCLEGDTCKEERKRQKERAQPENSAFQASGHVVFRIADSL
jgi:hypothetical protein